MVAASGSAGGRQWVSGAHSHTRAADGAAAHACNIRAGTMHGAMASPVSRAAPCMRRPD